MGRKSLVTLAQDAGRRLGRIEAQFGIVGEFLKVQDWKERLFPGMANVAKGVYCSRIRGLLNDADAQPTTLDQIDAIGIAWAGWMIVEGVL